MNRAIFEVADGGLAAVQPQRVVVIYGEQDVVKLSTTAAGIPVPKDTAVQRAAMRLTIAADAETQSAAGV